jgi:Ulp1 family protease
MSRRYRGRTTDQGLQSSGRGKEHGKSSPLTAKEIVADNMHYLGPSKEAIDDEKQQNLINRIKKEFKFGNNIEITPEDLKNMQDY